MLKRKKNRTAHSYYEFLKYMSYVECAITLTTWKIYP